MKKAILVGIILSGAAGLWGYATTYSKGEDGGVIKNEILGSQDVVFRKEKLSDEIRGLDEKIEVCQKEIEELGQERIEKQAELESLEAAEK